MTLTPYQPQGRDVVDGWAFQVAEVAKLAGYISGTDFVPRAYRGQDAAVAAAILTGRELGVGPMTALQHIYVVDGRPAMSAQLMRSLILAAGHTIRVTDWSSSRVELVGQRAGESTSTTITWSLEDARRAGLLSKSNWSRYPRAMLMARATAELGRVAFPDVIGGMAYTIEEAEDITVAEDNGAAAPTTKVRRQRAVTSSRRPSGATAVQVPDQAEPSLAGEKPDVLPAVASTAGGEGSALEAPPRPPSPPSPPPSTAGPTGEEAPTLLDDEAPTDLDTSQNEPFPAPQPYPPVPVLPPPTGTPEPPQPRQDTSWKPAAGAQMAMLFAKLADAGRMESRDERLRTVSGLAGRELKTMSQLTRGEAGALIDTLTLIEQNGDPEALEHLVERGWARIHEAQANEEDPS